MASASYIHETGSGGSVSKKGLNVLIAIDESGESFYALQWALDHLFPSMPAGSGGEAVVVEAGMMLKIVHVVQPFQQYILPAGPGVMYPVMSNKGVESVRKAQHENAGVLLEQALRLCKDKMVKVETSIMEGDPKDTICQAAAAAAAGGDHMHVDLLVLGSRGLGKIKRAFLGSVSDYCVHHARCPVLIIRPPPPPVQPQAS